MMGVVWLSDKAKPSLPIFHLPTSKQNFIVERFTLNEIKFHDFFYSFYQVLSFVCRFRTFALEQLHLALNAPVTSRVESETPGA